MLNCRQATQLISKSLDVSLPLAERLRVRIHLLACRACTRYRAHLRFLAKLVRDRMQVANSGEGIEGPGMPHAVRERIRNAIAGRGKA